MHGQQNIKTGVQIAVYGIILVQSSCRMIRRIKFNFFTVSVFPSLKFCLLYILI